MLLLPPLRLVKRAMMLLICLISLLFGYVQSKAQARPWLESHSGIANPLAVVVEGWARFTVLTPNVIRMESTPDTKFDDSQSINIINRALPVPVFEVIRSKGELRIVTSALELIFTPEAAPGSSFVDGNLVVKLRAFPFTVWTPSSPKGRNLHGTIRTLDRVGEAVDLTCVIPRDAMTYYAHCEEGLISRDGWVLVDDSLRPRLEPKGAAAHKETEWPWVKGPPAGNLASIQVGGALVYQDLYFFGHGLNYPLVSKVVGGGWRWKGLS